MCVCVCERERERERARERESARADTGTCMFVADRNDKLVADSPVSPCNT